MPIDDRPLAAKLERAVSREAIGLADGKSGTPIERVTLDDGSVVVTKTVSPYGDWIMRNMHDAGRSIELWARGILADVPSTVDHGVIGVVAHGNGWKLVMRDFSNWIFTGERRLSRGESRRLIEAFHALHVQFEDRTLDDLCPLADRYTVLSPQMSERERDGSDIVPKLVGRGWDIFATLVDHDVADVVARLHADPSPLVDALAQRPTTLIYGDMKLPNLGFAPDTVVAVDWGTQTGMAPPAVEWAWYLAISGPNVDAERESILEDVREVEGERHDAIALDLALLGGLVQLGWNKAFDAREHEDAAVRQRESAELDWWVRRARQTLEQHAL